MKRVLLIVVDGCPSRLLGPELESGRLPVLAQLVSRGTLRLDCVSIFPSITPAATASIATGRYPAQHGISGMSWWNPATGEVSYFGDDVRTVLRRGLGEFLHSFLHRLNGELLVAPTLFEVVERQGRRAACFNHLMFKGNVAHEVVLPQPLSLIPSLPTKMLVNGPSWLCLGDFVQTTLREADADATTGLFDRFGMDDTGTEAFLRGVPNAAALPDFTLAYFADYDFDSHERGPIAALETLRRLDRRLGRIFDAWGGLDRVLENAVVVLTADHAHNEVGGDGPAGIELDEILSAYQLATPAAGWQEGDQLLLCPNMRAAEVYISRDGSVSQADVCRAILREPRIDQVIWRSAEGTAQAFHVATPDRGTVSFRPARHDRSGVRDEYGASWELSGDPAAVDARIEGNGIRYGLYPNALERIANGMNPPRGGHVWVTARPGYEFQLPGQEVHRGAGSHGTLHELDSVVPLLVAGAPFDFAVTPRIVDVAPFCAGLMGIDFDTRAGEPHRA